MAFVDAALVASAPRSVFRGTAYRQQGPAYDPRSGEGARQRGGRFNPPGSFPVLYLCATRACAVAEFLRFAERQTIGPAGFLPRKLYRYDVDLTAVLDLTDRAVREHLVVGIDDVVGRDWGPTQHLGEVAHDLGFQAVLSPSATGVDHVLAVFTENVGLGTVEPQEAERWERLDQL